MDTGRGATEVYELSATVKRLHQRYEIGVLIVETGYDQQARHQRVEPASTNLTPIPAAGEPVAWKAWCAA